MTEKQKEMLMYGVVVAGVLGCAIYIYSVFFGGTPAPPPAPVIVAAPVAKTTSQATAKAVSTPPGFAVGGAAAQKIATTAGQLDPTLHEEAMHVTESLVYTGNGRNIFGIGPAPVVVAEVVRPVAPARPLPVAYVPPPPPPGPPPPPPIDIKFFGTATAQNGTRRAFLLHGDDVFLASDGEIVQRRYKVISIAANSITIEDLPNNNKQTLPLQAN
jgi:hypothetical protein